jgi:hypothetical protein
METLYLVLFLFQVIKFVGLFLLIGSLLVVGFLPVTSMFLAWIPSSYRGVLMKSLVVYFSMTAVTIFVEFSASNATTTTTSKSTIATNSTVAVALAFGVAVSLSHGRFAVVMALLSRVTMMTGAIITSLHVLLLLWWICSSYGSSSWA